MTGQAILHQIAPEASACPAASARFNSCIRRAESRSSVPNVNTGLLVESKLKAVVRSLPVSGAGSSHVVNMHVGGEGPGVPGKLIIQYNAEPSPGLGQVGWSAMSVGGDDGVRTVLKSVWRPQGLSGPLPKLAGLQRFSTWLERGDTENATS